jgi:hypothetical protein
LVQAQIRASKGLFAKCKQTLEGTLEHGVEAGFVAVQEVEAILLRTTFRSLCIQDKGVVYGDWG